MKISDMRKIAERRTDGDWEADHDQGTCWDVSIRGDPRITAENCGETNAKFIALAANTFDALLDVVEAAKKCRVLYPNADHINAPAIQEIEIFRNALKKLEDL